MSTQRIAVVAKLKAGSREQAEEIIEQGPPYALDQSGLERHSVFLASNSVVFVFEGQDVERVVRLLVDDPEISAGFGVWGTVLEGTPELARERFFWPA